MNGQRIQLKNNTSQEEQKNQIKTSLSKKSNKNSKYTENWIPIKTIKDGIVYTTDNKMVVGLKIEPKNIFILEQSVTDNTIYGLMNFYNSIDYEFWLIVADRPVDIAMYQAELQLLYNKNQNQMMRKIISQDMNKGDMFVDSSVVDTEYFILFKEKEKNSEIAMKKLRTMINSLASAGIVASPTSNDDMRMLVDNFLNGGKKYESGMVMI